MSDPNTFLIITWGSGLAALLLPFVLEFLFDKTGRRRDARSQDLTLTEDLTNA
ncbi:MAG TPA: hypothetical protein VK575_09430 [Gemmatimonadaceae bacterium]|nr:hypothetical protein [Gemmatimonadaceae bacterium]